MPTKSLINKKYKLQRFQGKGGWTYASIPEVVKDKNSPFGWVRVKGFIDDYEFKNYHLMPMGNGSLFLPVKAEIRKRIGKKEGDMVTIILYKDDSPLEIPDELLACLRDEPMAFELFKKMGEGYQKEYISWIYSAKREETRITRIAKTIEKVLKGQTLSKKPE
jgi:bifunctional DNA-binding transcriptional regulator/antitoxin component of YhaV-PrlF toxin-antitoxin module